MPELTEKQIERIDEGVNAIFEIKAVLFGMNGQEGTLRSIDKRINHSITLIKTLWGVVSTLAIGIILAFIQFFIRK